MIHLPFLKVSWILAKRYNFLSIEMKRISNFMIIVGVLVVGTAIVSAEMDWVQIMFGTFLCVGGYFISKEQG